MSAASSSPSEKFSAAIDLLRVRQLFSAPPNRIDANFFTREIAQRMQERLQLIRLQPQRVLDAGCGDGADLLALRQIYPEADALGIDAAAVRLARAIAQRRASGSTLQRWFGKWLPANDHRNVHLLCGDFANLPLAAQSLELIWSNLALHWHPQPHRIFAEWRRVLSVDGLLMFSCFGPDTFRELRTAFAAVDRHAHVLPFVDMHDLGDMLIDAGFSTPVMDMETITLTYVSVEKLLADARVFGGNPLADRRRGLIGRKAWQKLIAGLEQLRGGDGRIGLTLEVIYGHAFKPVASKTAAGEAIVRFDLRRGR